MRCLLIATVALGTGVFTTNLVHAEELHFGSWKFVSSEEASGTSKRICGMTSGTTDKNHQQEISVLSVQGDKNLIVKITNKSWNFNARPPSSLAIFFSTAGQYGGRFVDGSGYRATMDAQSITVVIDAYQASNFLSKITNADAIQIKNRSDSAMGTKVRSPYDIDEIEPEIIVPLEGAKAASNSLIDCQTNNYRPVDNRTSDVETKQMFRPWKFLTGTNRKGAPFCGISSASGDEQNSRRIILAQIRGVEKVIFELGKTDWSIPPNTQSELTLTFGSNELSYLAHGNGQEITVLLEQTDASVLSSALASFPTFKVTFPHGSEPTWTISTRNVQQSIKSVTECQQNDFQVSVGNPSPNSSSKPTQPFSYSR